jgi:hypothetical protein
MSSNAKKGLLSVNQGFQDEFKAAGMSSGIPVEEKAGQGDYCGLEGKRLILARLKNSAAELWCVRLRDAKYFSREPARGIAA